MGMGFLESVDKHPPLSPCSEYVLVRDGDAVSANLQGIHAELFRHFLLVAHGADICSYVFSSCNILLSQLCW